MSFCFHCTRNFKSGSYVVKSILLDVFSVAVDTFNLKLTSYYTQMQQYLVASAVVVNMCTLYKITVCAISAVMMSVSLCLSFSPLVSCLCLAALEFRVLQYY